MPLRQRAVRYAFDGQPLQTQGQDHVSSAIGQLQGIELLDGLRILQTEITTSATDIEHRLGRAWRGWIVLRKSADAGIWEATQTDATRFLTLIAINPVTVDLWVF